MSVTNNDNSASWILSLE